MKKLLLYLLVAGLAATAQARPGASPDAPTGALSAEERAAAVALLTQTRADILQSVRGLSAAQLAYRTAPARWSIAECLEHIALAETGIFQMQQTAMQAPADPARRADIKVTDTQVVQRLTNRRGTAQSPEILKPTGRFPTSEAALEFFGAERDKTLAYVRTVSDDLRVHYWQHPATGPIDAYQTLLLLAAHSERHRLQIEEVKASPGFPKA
ncbi:DinB family protein [Hymenobacter sp.]|uniref:DinB family protein n=1 Tax=Hymenobacter sp. TaxID=1898978 RepID=UPI00286C5C85|nr:DinB family protein [Hymenobacter sp.]